MTQGVQPAHSPQISTVDWLHLIPRRDQFGNALGGIHLPDNVAPTDSYSAINFSKLDPNSLSIDPLSLIRLVDDTLTTLFITGSINDTTLRSEGICLLSGFFTPPSSSTLHALYPTHSSYVSKYTTAADAAGSAGFITPFDRGTLVAAAQAASIP
jgi:hypothetical protein